MKRLLIAAATALCLLVPAVPALCAGESSDAAAADQTAALQKMQQELLQMQQEMDRIRKTQDSAKRRALMQRHWQSMMHGMQTMHQCCGGPMMGKMGMGAPGCCKGGVHGQMMLNPEMMQNRMDVMQMMMDQIMQYQQMLQRSR